MTQSLELMQRDASVAIGVELLEASGKRWDSIGLVATQMPVPILIGIEETANRARPAIRRLHSVRPARPVERLARTLVEAGGSATAAVGRRLRERMLRRFDFNALRGVLNQAARFDGLRPIESKAGG